MDTTDHPNGPAGSEAPVRSGGSGAGSARRRPRYRWVMRMGIGLVLGAALVVVLANLVVYWRGHNRVFTDFDEVRAWAEAGDKPVDAVIVPGAGLFVEGRPSLVIQRRVDAATELFNAGVVDHVLVSGDNGRVDYDEPTGIRRLVHADGVPLADITVDYAGFSTWDTCRRADQIFGVERAVFVTQDRYADRAAALCTAAGLDVVVYAQPTGRPPTLKRRIWDRVRERLAAVKATYEIVVTPDPRFLGPFEGLPGSERPANPDPALGETRNG